MELARGTPVQQKLETIQREGTKNTKVRTRGNSTQRHEVRIGGQFNAKTRRRKEMNNNLKSI
jgi:hypothetical protein